MQPSLSKNTKIVFVGGGKMGEAIFSGLISSKDSMAAQITADMITVVAPTESHREQLSERYGVSCVDDVSSVSAADIVVMAVKPQVIIGVMQQMQNLPAFKNTLVISIAVGLTTKTLGEILPEQARLVRVMPNLPLVVGAGASVVCGSASSSDAEVEWVCYLFNCLGQAYIIDEGDIDAAGAVSGSGPAYVCAMIEALTQAAINEGITAKLAEELVVQMLYGTAMQLKETKVSPAELREAVCSPKGTTLAALAAMNEAGMQEVYAKGVAAAIKRSKELS